MHFHLPKPLHGWRQFIGEVGIIILGVLIALGAEQLLQAAHDRHVAAQTSRDVREEAAIGLAFNLSRLQESPCVFARLTQLDAMLDKGAVPAGAPIWVGRPDDMPIFTDRWHAVTASARSAMFPPDEQARFDNLYAHFARFEQFEKLEQAAWTDLRVMERLHGAIDPQTRFTLMRAAEEARHQDFKIRNEAYFAKLTARQLGIAPNRRYGRVQARAICLPITTNPDEAQKVLTGVNMRPIERPD